MIESARRFGLRSSSDSEIKVYWKPVKSEVHLHKPNNINDNKMFLVK